MTEPLSPTPSMIKRLKRSLAVYQIQGTDPAIAYLAQAFTSVSELERMLAGATLPARMLVKAAQQLIVERKACKAIKHQVQSREAAEYHRQKAENDRAHNLAITENLEALTDQLQRIRYIASLSLDDRVRVANKQDQRACIELRKACVTTAKARALIGATQTEFDRWVEEGLITHVYLKRISVGKMVNARYWSTAELEAFEARVPTLRDVWATRKKARRTKLKLVSA